ncbi:MAG: site-2 protease family protein [Candidatus Woesearchaeota archaeon]|nr:site-2 protease family protein [Candidatus Woesearchaeota archaeon]
MLDFQSIAAILFILILSVILYYERKRIQVQKILYPLLYFVMYRTKVGLNLMDRWSKKYKKLLNILGTIGIVIGYIGMVLIAILLIKNIYDIFTKPAAVAGVALVLPFKVKGAVFVPFFYWIISIFVLAVVHEFSHGVIARLYKVKIKSSGFAALAIFLPILPAAFVEPDEKQVQKIPKKQQLAIFAAGPFSNIVTALIIVLLFLTLLKPLIGAVMIDNGVKIVSISTNETFPLPAQSAGLTEEMIITKIDDNEIKTVDDFKATLEGKPPGASIDISTNSTTYTAALGFHPDEANTPYLGVSVVQDYKQNPDFIEKYGLFTTKAILWILGLLYWLYVLNLGIGLFNLVPLGPIDGGRMLLTGLTYFLPEQKARDVWTKISWVFLLLIIGNIAAAFI